MDGGTMNSDQFQLKKKFFFFEKIQFYWKFVGKAFSLSRQFWNSSKKADPSKSFFADKQSSSFDAVLYHERTFFLTIQENGDKWRRKKCFLFAKLPEAIFNNHRCSPSAFPIFFCLLMQIFLRFIHLSPSVWEKYIQEHLIIRLYSTIMTSCSACVCLSVRHSNPWTIGIAAINLNKFSMSALIRYGPLFLHESLAFKCAKKFLVLNLHCNQLCAENFLLDGFLHRSPPLFSLLLHIRMVNFPGG